MTVSEPTVGIRCMGAINLVRIRLSDPIQSIATVRSLLNEGSFWLTHCPQICIRNEISRPGFLDVNRYSVVHSIDLRRVFLRYVNMSMCKFGDSVSCLGLYGGLYGQNLPYKFKKSYGDFRNRNFEKSYRTTGPRSDMRPDS